MIGPHRARRGGTGRATRGRAACALGGAGWPASTLLHGWPQAEPSRARRRPVARRVARRGVAGGLRSIVAAAERHSATNAPGHDGARQRGDGDSPERQRVGELSRAPLGWRSEQRRSRPGRDWSRAPALMCRPVRARRSQRPGNVGPRQRRPSDAGSAQHHFMSKMRPQPSEPVNEARRRAKRHTARSPESRRPRAEPRGILDIKCRWARTAGSAVAFPAAVPWLRRARCWRCTWALRPLGLFPGDPANLTFSVRGRASLCRETHVAFQIGAVGAAVVSGVVAILRGVTFAGTHPRDS
jgi:hypothetical protein